MGKPRKAKRKPQTEYAEPTSEQLANGDYHRELMTYRRTPVIRTLLATGKISQRQFNGLARYADIANLADRSELRSCIDFSVRGNGDGFDPFGIRTNIELGRLERVLGALRPIAHAVAVRDVTLAQWAIQRAGSVMRDRTVGAKIVTWFEPRRSAAKIALVDIRFAGERLAAEIGA